MSESGYKCLNCGEKFSPNEKICPKCGSNKKRPFAVVANGFTVWDSQKGKRKDKSGKKPKVPQEVVKRRKLGGNGKQAEEEQYYDRERNWYTHHVNVRDENGSWKTDHHEEEPLSKHGKKQKKRNRT